MFVKEVFLCACGFYLIILHFCVISYAARAPQVGLALTGFFKCFFNGIFMILCVVIKSLRLFEPCPLPRPLTYKDTKVERKSAMKLKVDHFKQQAEFFGKIFLTLESRDRDLKEFF